MKKLIAKIFGFELDHELQKVMIYLSNKPRFKNRCRTLPLSHKFCKEYFVNPDKAKPKASPVIVGYIEELEAEIERLKKH